MSWALRRQAFVQHGVVSRSQALEHGLSRHAIERLVEQRQWQRLADGLFLTGSGQPPWRARAWAAVLAGGPGARLGGAAAAHLGRLLDTPPELITVLVPHDRTPKSRSGWIFQRERAGVRDRRSYGDPPRIGIEDAVLDLCDRGRPEDVAGWVTAAIQRRLTTPKRIEQALSRRTRHRHRQLIGKLIRATGEGAESPLEVAYLEIEEAHGLPRGRRQVRSKDGRSVRDVLYDAERVIVELDGRTGHEGSGRVRDMWRDNVASTEGWNTLRYGSYDLARNPCDIARQVAKVLRAHGWTAQLRPCVRCRLVS
jgi:very-short-patch-repair endonuclease